MQLAKPFDTSGKSPARLYRRRTRDQSRLIFLAQTDKLIALRGDRIRRIIGRIDAETSEKLDRALLLVLGLSR